MTNYNVKLSQVLKEAMEDFKQAAVRINDNWQVELGADYPFATCLNELLVDIRNWGEYADMDEEPTELEKSVENLQPNHYKDIPLIDYVAYVLSDIRNDTSYDILGSIEYDYTAKDILKYIRPLLNDENVSYDVFYNDNNQYSAILRIY